MSVLQSEIGLGKKLPVVERFYSVQGEGYNTGKAAYFIRLAGCDVCCPWCDAKVTWKSSDNYISVEELVGEVVKQGVKYVVITGGEPLMHPLDYICTLLKENNVEVFLETSGTHSLSGSFDWICLSPKKHKQALGECYKNASELKIIIETEDDFNWAEQNRRKVNKECILYLQPEWSKKEESLPLIIEYMKKNPCWNLSLQTHKFIDIP